MWFGNTMRMTLCTYVQLARQARESNKRRLMSRWKNEGAIEEETVRGGPDLNLLLMEESAGRSWHGMGRSSTYTTACNCAIPIQANYALHSTAQHSTMSRQSSNNSTYTCMHVLAQVAVSVCRIYPGYFAGQKRIDRSRKRRTPTHRCRMATDGAEALLLVMHTGLEEKNLTCPMYMLD